MTDRLALASTQAVVTEEQLELVKRTVANGATPAELKLYLYDCQRQGVHPLDRLLHFTKRGGKYTPVTSIDLMRIRAAETNEYAGSDDAKFQLQPDVTYPVWAQVTVWRLVQGTRYAFTATARWDEYYPGDQGGHMWRKMPHTMLGKCAEALALRKGFPRQLAGLYASEELDQADRKAPTSALVASTAAPGDTPPAPSGGDSGHSIIDTETGEERPTPPAGYFYVTDYDLRNGWHEFRLLNYDAQGGAITLSTKKNIGSVANQAQQDGIPVKVKTTPKKNGAPGEAYLEAIETLKLEALPSVRPFARPPKKVEAGTCPECGLSFAECTGHGAPLTDDDIAF